MHHPSKYEKAISSGAIGLLYAAKNKEFPGAGENLFTIRRLSKDTKFDGDCWKKMSSNPLKPHSIPYFYDSFREDSGDWHIVLEFMSKSLKNFLDRNQNQKTMSVTQIYGVYKNIVNCLAFLQSIQISHTGLSTENIYMNSGSEQVFVLDFVKENDFENHSSCLAKFLK